MDTAAKANIETLMRASDWEAADAAIEAARETVDDYDEMTQLLLLQAICAYEHSTTAHSAASHDEAPFWLAGKKAYQVASRLVHIDMTAGQLVMFIEARAIALLADFAQNREERLDYYLFYAGLLRKEVNALEAAGQLTRPTKLRYFRLV